MQSPFPTHLPAAPRRTGALLSIAGLVAWLAALLLAVTGPLLGFEVPAPYLLGAIVFAAAFAVISLTYFVEIGRNDHN